VGGAVIVPRHIVAALRTIQAYGNYASHLAVGEPPMPPAEAAESARASLVLLTEWFLETLAAGAGRALPLREPAPRTSRLGAYRLSRELGISHCARITHRRGAPFSARKCVDTEQSPTVQLHQLQALLAEHVDAAERVGRIVLRRETTLEPMGWRLSDLAPLMARLSSRRPSALPRSVAMDFQELERLRANVHAAASSTTPEPGIYLAALETRQHGPEIVEWFHSRYLGRSHVARHWPLYVIILALLLPIMNECSHRSSPEKAVADAHRRLFEKYCRSRPNLDWRSLCDELSPPPAAPRTGEAPQPAP
jgi:hypothetical protein